MYECKMNEIYDEYRCNFIILWVYGLFCLMQEKLERNKDTFLEFICTLDIIQPWNQ